MDAHFHGHDGVLLLAEYSFAEITLGKTKSFFESLCHGAFKK